MKKTDPPESLCEMCGNPMPPGEEMFRFHGYSCDCPPKCPPCPLDRKPHRDRVKEIDSLLPEGMTAAIGIDNTPEHVEWYLYELKKYPRLTIVYQETLADSIHIIKVLKGPPLN